MSTHLLIRANVSQKVLMEAYHIATAFESRYSAYKEDSFLNEINRASGRHPLICSDDDMELFRTSLEASRQTNGLFDISMGALTHGAYHFGFANQTIATTKQVTQQKKLVNYKNIKLEPNSIFLSQKGMRIDLGGIGKGYVAKKIALFLQKAGASKFLVDVGGEIITFGKSYSIAIKNPFAEGNIGLIKTSKAPLSISTSGDYERFINTENHHILNHNLGTSPHFYSSMSILKNGWEIDLLDAYATAMFNLPPLELQKRSKALDISLFVIDKEKNLSFYGRDKLEIKGIEIG